MQNVAYYELTASEFDWSISANKTITAWGLNNTVPGPVLKAKKGDLLVVKLINQLPEPTMIHWHGIRLPASMDGTGEVQQPVLPGESFEYRFIVPDAGTFWYHSHHNETVQMERGMYGALIVEEETELVTDGEKVFMIDDMKLTTDYHFKKGNTISRWAERHDGRQGDTLLINGKENTVIPMAAGQTERWRFINSSSARYFNLSFGGRAFRVIATDGGLIDTAQEQTELLITPGERYDILMGPFAAGETFGIDSLAYNRTTFLKAKKERFANVEVTEAKASVAVTPTRLNNILPIAASHAPITRHVKLSVGPSLKRGIDFLVNNNIHTNDRPVYVGEQQVWELSNTSLMDHPFHLHGFFFQVLEINGKAPSYTSWKDTVNLPPKSKVKIAWMPDDRPGIWMYHCHIIEHHAAGMMANFQVLRKGEVAMEQSHHCHA